jgi:hypothetical protein
LHVTTGVDIVLPAAHEPGQPAVCCSFWNNSSAALFADSQSVAPATGMFFAVPQLVSPGFSSMATDQPCAAAGMATRAMTTNNTEIFIATLLAGGSEELCNIVSGN